MVNKKTKKDLNEEIDCLKKKVNTLENVTKDLLSKINKMLSEPKKSEEQNVKDDISPNLMLKCELCDYICAKKDEMKEHKINRHQEVCHKVCTICGTSFLQNHELETHLKSHTESERLTVPNVKKKITTRLRKVGTT